MSRLLASSVLFALIAAPAFAADPAPAPTAPAATSAPTATAEGTQSVTLPTGKTKEAQKFVHPVEGSVEWAYLEAMKAVKAGDFDGYIKKWCSKTTCVDATANESLKTYQLTASSKSAGQCMTDDGGVLVTKHETDPDGSHRIYVFCGNSRMPAPASLVMEDGSWKMTSFSW